MIQPKITAVLIDTVSIQHYIFSSNKLRDNLGASYIIEELVYKKNLYDICSRQFDGSFSADWEDDPEHVRILSDPKCDCEVGYIGGGNALVLFKSRTAAKRFIRRFSLALLKRYPGLKTALGLINEFDPHKGFQTSRERLNCKLILNRNLQYRNTTVFKHGIVDDCRLSNEAREIKYNEDYISMSSRVKLRASKVSQAYLNEKYKDILGDEYVFTEDIDKLGQPAEKGYVAVVHVDGNGMGKRFLACSTLKELRKLSSDVSSLADEAMRELIQYITDCFKRKILNSDALKKFVPDKNAKEDERSWEGRLQLPIRPIVTGGDDITFVCDGRLGVHLAEKMIDIMTKIPVQGECISACGGVAIVKTKYPFYRAYRLAEELTAQAKKASRPIQEGSSWLSFLVSAGGYSGSLEELLHQQYRTPQGNLLTMIPYRLDGSHNSLQQLKNGILLLTAGDTRWPKSKIIELRSALSKDEHARKYFLIETAARRLAIPSPGSQELQDLWDSRTQKLTMPYYDMIELIDFYPKELLDGTNAKLFEADPQN